MTFAEMPQRAKLYWFLILISGCVCFLSTMIGPRISGANITRLAAWAMAAALASDLKIKLPRVFGTLSMNYVFIIAALHELGPRAGIIVAITGTLVQCFLHAGEQPRWFQVVFSVSGIALPVLVANFVMALPWITDTDHSGCLSLLAGSLAYFGINTLIVAAIVGLTTARSFLNLWRTSYLWTFPQYLVGGAIAALLHLLKHYMGWPGLVMTVPALYLVYRSFNQYLSRFEEQQKHILDMAQLHLRTIETLALAIDAKDDTTAAHLRRVQIYASEIGKELNLSEPEMKALEAAALLHDVGKLAVPEYIVAKPGRLTPEEFEKMKVHPVVGAEILERVQFPYPVVPIVRSHHEKFDGTGYPDGLAGDQIPIGARILSAVDCLDALASDRQYRKAIPLEDAMNIVVKESGCSYDPQVVGILQRRFRELEARARSETIETVKLSSNVKIVRGAAPATGFAEAAAPPAKADFSIAISGARREFQLLNEVTNDLGSSLGVEETLAILGVRLNRIIDHDSIVIYLLKDAKLRPRYARGESYRLFSSLEIPVGQGLAGWVAENDLPIVNGNPAVEPGYLNDPRMVTSLRAAIAVPLKSNGRIVGVLSLYSMNAEAFTSDHKRLLMAIAPKAGLAIENAVRFENAISAADTDELTGVSNSRFLFAHLEKEMARNSRNGGEFAVILIDLDGFKSANDQFGHLAGNRILHSFAQGLKHNSRGGDVVARLGGDEFVLVLPDAGDHVEECLARLDQIVDNALLQFSTGVQFSAGVARYPADGTTAEALLERADERMYEAKRSKKLAQIAA